MVLSKDPNYERIRARTTSVTARASYWLARDHLLVVGIETATERYRRFNLDDLQAVVIRHTNRFALWNVILGVLDLLLVSFMIMLAQGDQGAFVVCGVFLSVLILITIVHVARGPTVSCDLITAVQNFRMPGVVRRRDADRIVAALKAHAEKLQPVSSDPAPETSPLPSPPANPETP